VAFRRAQEDVVGRGLERVLGQLEAAVQDINLRAELGKQRAAVLLQVGRGHTVAEQLGGGHAGGKQDDRVGYIAELGEVFETAGGVDGESAGGYLDAAVESHTWVGHGLFASGPDRNAATEAVFALAYGLVS
jgi:hypothetical protein